jgi:hypothetical protein
MDAVPCSTELVQIDTRTVAPHWVRGLRESAVVEVVGEVGADFVGEGLVGD